jgi:DNA repair exonuclease SbcCD ATPase subunit
MIHFRKLRYRNFLSSGDKFTEISFDETPTTLIVGRNGSGKSTVLDALSFALFGKPHRNINKPQLVNSINKKKCEVEIEFDIGSDSYHVIRGISPAVFLIKKNGESLDKAANIRDQQKVLEQNILKLNHKSFHQVVVLGSSSFTPFMQLTTPNRRVVIEDLLDIGVFSTMGALLKQENAELRDQIKDARHQRELIESNIETQEKSIERMRDIDGERRKAENERINEIQAKIARLENDNDELSQSISDESEARKQNNALHNNRQTINESLVGLRRDMASLAREAKFFMEKDSCPTCGQDISDDLREKNIKDAKTKARSQKNEMADLTEKMSAVEEDMQTIEKRLQDIARATNQIAVNNRVISESRDEIDRIKASMENTVEATSLSESVQALERAKADLADVKDKLNRLGEDQNYKMLMLELLKDDGIKTRVIRRYLPIINQLVNRYLSTMDFSVAFWLDESFNEEIRSRHRDVFSYENFSEGEKQRIDLALLFTWREVARMKNSISTNLLILDETFDSSLDNDGIDNLTQILNTITDQTNVIIISHKGEVLEGKFDRKLEFAKQKNFSVLMEAA